MTGIIDTHILVWHLTNGRKLSKAEARFLGDDANRLVLPTIVLCEAKYLIAKGRITILYDRLVDHLTSDPRVTIHPLDENVVAGLPTSLEIHDAIIVATYFHYREEEQESVVLLSQDSEIRRSRLARVLT